jgi:hypothetical protein
MPTKPSSKKPKVESTVDGAFDQVLRRMLETPPDPKVSPKKPKKKLPEPRGGTR